MTIDPPIRRYFNYGHLPPHLQAVSRPFASAADQLIEAANENPAPIDGAELQVALRKLLEGKDAAVRAFLATK